METKVSVVIPSYNGRRFLERCIPAVAAAIDEWGGEGAEIVVVDDCSTDGTAEWLGREWGEVRCVGQSRNTGFAAAANAGIAASRGEWVALLNNDTEVERGWIWEAARHFGGERVGCVSSRVVDMESGLTESAGDGYTYAGIAYQRDNGRARAGGAESYRTFSACAAAAFYREKALGEAGGFEERFESYYEDVDLGFRLNLLGWETVCEGRSVCRHARGGSYGGMPAKRVRNSSRNIEMVYFSCMPRGLLLRSLPAHVAGVFAQGALRAWQGRLGAFVRGKVEFVREAGWVARRRRGIQRGAREEGVKAVESLVEREWVRIHIARRRRAGSGSEGVENAAEGPVEVGGGEVEVVSVAGEGVVEAVGLPEAVEVE